MADDVILDQAAYDRLYALASAFAEAVAVDPACAAMMADACAAHRGEVLAFCMSAPLVDAIGRALRQSPTGAVFRGVGVAFGRHIGTTGGTLADSLRVCEFIGDGLAEGYEEGAADLASGALEQGPVGHA